MESMRATCLSLMLAALCIAGNASADTPALIGGNVQFMTNYVGRGLAQSLGNPSVEGELDFNTGDGWYGGIDGNSINWVDQLYPGDSVGVEIDYWAGYRLHFAQDWSWKAGFLRLQFPGTYVPQKQPTDEPNTTEAFGYVSWKNLSARFNYAVTNSFATPDSKGSWYLDTNDSQSLDEHWSLIEHLGRKHEAGTSPAGVKNDRNDYTDYKGGVVYYFTPDLSLTLAHTWTNADPPLYTLHGYFVGGHHTWLLLEKDF